MVLHALPLKKIIHVWGLEKLLAVFYQPQTYREYIVVEKHKDN